MQTTWLESQCSHIQEQPCHWGRENTSHPDLGMYGGNIRHEDRSVLLAPSGKKEGAETWESGPCLKGRTESHLGRRSAHKDT